MKKIINKVKKLFNKYGLIGSIIALLPFAIPVAILIFIVYQMYKVTTNPYRLNSKFLPVFNQFKKEVEAAGYKVIVTSTFRSTAEQEALRKAGETSVFGGNSPHNFGMAVDINIQRNGVKWMKATSKQDWINTGVPAIAKRLGLRWGGDFIGYHDPVHFDFMSGYSTEQLKTLANVQGIDENELYKINLA